MRLECLYMILDDVLSVQVLDDFGGKLKELFEVERAVLVDVKLGQL